MAKDKNPTAAAADVVAPVNEAAAYVSKRERMAAYLNAQPKVAVMIPNVPGQPPEYTVTMNGVTYIVPVGEKSEVPQPVADIINERLSSEGILKKKSDEMVDAMKKAGV